MKVLCLNGCYIGHVGTLCLARVIPYMHSLEKLDLNRNDIGDRGVAELAHALVICTTTPICRQLRELHMDSNNIRKRGAMLLGSMLSAGKFVGLRTLSLAYNELGPLSSSLLEKVPMRGSMSVLPCEPMCPHDLLKPTASNLACPLPPS